VALLALLALAGCGAARVDEPGPALRIPAARIAAPAAVSKATTVRPAQAVAPSLVGADKTGTVLDEARLHQYFGSFSVARGPDGTVAPDARWVRAAIADWRVPVLGTVRCHRNILPQLYYAMREIQQRGLAPLIRSYDGCYVPRFQRLDDTVLSAHTWGIAIDINASQIPQGEEPAMDPRVVSIMQRWGFAWGGNFDIPDGMHFEFARFPRA